MYDERIIFLILAHYVLSSQAKQDKIVINYITDAKKACERQTHQTFVPDKKGDIFLMRLRILRLCLINKIKYWISRIRDINILRLYKQSVNKSIKFD